MAETNIPVPPAQPAGQSSTVVEGTPPAAQADTNDLSSKFAHLARKEKAFRAEQRKFQTERDAWKAQQTQYDQALGIANRIDRDPLGVLADRGITQDQLTSLLVNSSNPQEANHLFQLQQENKTLQAKIEQINKRFEDNDKTSYDQALNQIGYDAKMLINSDADKFELVNIHGEEGIEAIKELCRVVWEEDKVLLTVQEAAEQVEQELYERAQKLASAKKLKPKEAAPVEPTQTHTNLSKTQSKMTLNSQGAQKISAPVRNNIERAKMRFMGIDPDTGEKIGAVKN